MINNYLKSSARIERMRSGSVGPYIDDFASALASAGYSPHTIREYIRSATHIGLWIDRRGIALRSWDDDVLQRFRRHLSRCKCVNRSKGGIRLNSVNGIDRFIAFLRDRALIASSKPISQMRRFAPISEQFADWLTRHRGVTSSSALRFQTVLRPLLADLGDDPTTYTVERIRSFVIAQIGKLGRGGARLAVTGIRAFFRFLLAEGRVTSDLAQCVPTVPQWRLSSLPRYLESADVARVIGSCDLTTRHGRRDHAILLLLARLGLRAGDIVQMTLRDIDWQRGALRVGGKGRRDTLLPLPQATGDAVLYYIEHARPRSSSDRLFLTVCAPTRPFASSATVSDIVRFALMRAGIHNPPSRGAHLLRHSAATAMLRAGSSLDTIKTVLRHESPDTTAHYAKVDIAMLQEVAQPWPAGASC